MAREKQIKTPEQRLKEALVPRDEQPYAVPDNWCWVRAASICTFIGGGTPDKSNPSYWGGDIPWASIKDIKGDRLSGTIDSITEEGFNNSAANMCMAGDLILATRINPGDTIISDVDVAVNQDLKIVKSTIASDYLHLSFKVMKPALAQKASGSTVKGIKLADVKALPIPFPPLAEQRRIVERVEGLFAKLDGASQALNEMIGGSEERRSSMLRSAFNGDLTARWRAKRGMGLDSWERTTIGKCCRVGSGGTPSRKNPANYAGVIPWVKTGEINWNCIVETEEHISQDALETSSAKLYQPGAVLVAMYGMGQTRGKAALLEIPAATNQAVCVLEPDERLDRRYLYYFFMRNYWDIREQSIGGNQLNLSGTIIKQYEICLPSIEEQRAIADVLENALGKEDLATSVAIERLESIQVIKQRILSDALRGRLDTNGSDDSSAKEQLLEMLEHQSAN